MAAPVWVLSVDLQTKTASFTTGLADAARQARGSFNEISSGARDMGSGVAQGGTNVRAAIGLVDNTIRGNHAAAMADLIREFSHTGVVMAALPFAAVLGGIAAVAAIVVAGAMHIKEMREEQEKLTNEETRFGTAVNVSFGNLDARLLEAEKKSDELKNDHLGALRAELALIDHTSMAELVKSFDLISKASDATMAGLVGHWYTFGIGSAGATHALEQFKTQYESLLAKGDDKGASDLLAGTKQSAEAVLKLQQQAIDNQGTRTASGTTGNYAKVLQAENELKKSGVGYTEKEVVAQRVIVQALQEQAVAQGKIEELKKRDAANATTSTGNDASARASEAAKQGIAARASIAEQSLAGDRATADAGLTIARAAVEARLASDLDFAKRDYEIKADANRQTAGALDKAGKDYANQLAESHNKAGELTAAYEAQQAELRSRAAIEQNTRDLANMEAGQRALIAATSEGSQERLSVVQSAMTKAQQAALQDTDFYRSLGTEQSAIIRQIATEEAKTKAEAGKEAADAELKSGELELAAQEQSWNLQASARRVTEAQRMAEETEVANAEFALKLAANLHEQAALDTSGKDFENKLKALQNKETQLIRAHENEKTRIKDQAVINQNTRAANSYKQLEDMAAQGLTSVIMRHQSFATMLSSIGDQVTSGMMQHAMQDVMANDFTRESDAAKAARKAFNIGMDIGGPAGFILGPVMGAAAFASVMAFAGGTDGVPGTGRGDVVPAMLTPGEGVVPGGVMDGLRTMARSGGFDKQPAMTIHPTFSPTIHALDSDGVDKVLEHHGKKFQAHFEKVLRKMNR